MMVPEFAPHSYGFPEGTAEAETFILHVLCDHPQNGNPFNSLNRPFFHLRHWEAKEEELLRIIALRNKSSDLAFSCAEQLVKRIFAELIETGICRFSLPAAPEPVRQSVDTGHRGNRTSERGTVPASVSSGVRDLSGGVAPPSAPDARTAPADPP